MLGAINFNYPYSRCELRSNWSLNIRDSPKLSCLLISKIAAKSETRQGLPNKLWNEQVPVGGLYSIDGPVLLLNGLPLYL